MVALLPAFCLAIGGQTLTAKRISPLPESHWGLAQQNMVDGGSV